MNGLLPISIQQNGRMLLKVAIAILVLSLFLSGCFSIDWWVGDGRGDWTLDLYEGYAISKINSREILLVYKEKPSDSGGAIILLNYFVVAYQLHEPYICLKGIRTQEIAASEEELNAKVFSYYLIDASNGEVIGPFHAYDDFVQHCNSLSLEIKDEWIKAEK